MSSSSSPALDKSNVQPFDYAEVCADRTDHSATAEAQKQALEAVRREIETQARARYDEQLTRARDAFRVALAEFARERQVYFQKIESEVLQLALAIARKILHREAQIDPLLLAGLVRLALENLQASTRVKVRVSPQQAADWRAYFSRTVDPADIPEVVEDPAQESGCCVLETAVGTTQLGIEPQLKEIEQGLMDLLAQKPTSPQSIG